MLVLIVSAAGHQALLGLVARKFLLATLEAGCLDDVRVLALVMGLRAARAGSLRCVHILKMKLWF